MSTHLQKKTCVEIFPRNSSVYETDQHINRYNSGRIVFLMLGIILTESNVFFLKRIAFCRSMSLKKVMKLDAFIFNAPAQNTMSYRYFMIFDDILL